MSLRFKAWLLFGLSFALLIPVVLVILHFTVLRSFSRFEESAARRDVERALRAVDAEAGHLETTVMDWAEWDDSYEFMATHRDAYESANLGDDTFRSLELSLMAFVRPSGEVVYGRVYDPQTAQSAELPAEVKRTLADEAAAMHAVGGGLGRRGVLRFADGPRLVAIRRILRSDNSGPSRGILVMGRPFDTEILAHLGGALDLALTLRDLDGLPPASDFGRAAVQLSRQDPIVILPMSSELISGFGLIADVHDRPAMLIRVTQGRAIAAQGRAVARYLLLALLAALGVSGLAVQLILERGVIGRLGALDDRLREIGRTGNLGSRVRVSGSDEVANLGHGINTMLGALQKAEGSVRESEERYRAIVEGQTELICRWRPDGTLVFANQACRPFAPGAAESLAGVSFHDLAGGEGPAGAGAPDLPSADRPVSTFLRRRSQDGAVRWVQWTNHGIFDPSGRLVEVQSVGRDVTQQRESDAALRTCEHEARTLLAAPAELTFLTDFGGTVLASNESTASRLEITVVRLVGGRIQDLLGDDVATRWRVHAEEAIRTGRPSRLQAQLRGRTLDLAVLPIRDAATRIGLLGTVARDVTDQHRAEQAEQRLQETTRRAELLERVSQELVRAEPSGPAVFDRIVRLITPELGDLCVLHVLGDGARDLLPVTFCHRDAETDGRLHRTVRPTPRPLVCGLARRALDTGSSQVLPSADPLAVAAELLPEMEPYLARFSAVGLVVTPIVLAERPVGLLTIVREPSPGTPAPPDSSFAEEVATRAGIAIGQVHLFNELQSELRERGRLEEALDDAQVAFRQISRSLRGVVWIREAATGQVTYVSPGYEHVWGRSCESLYRDPASLLDAVHPEDRERVARALSGDASPQADAVELRVGSPDGPTRWVVLRQVRLDGGPGRTDKVFALGEDVTEQKEAEAQSRRLEAQLRLLARRLDEAREEERHRLAIWIHDEIGQMLTALRLDLAWVLKRLPPKAAEMRDALLEMDTLVAGKVGAVQQVSGELRPTLLEDLGFKAATEWLVRQFSRRTSITVDLEVEAGEEAIPPAVSLALFRIVQEALTNVARHAAASRVRIALEANAGSIVLRVADDGRGIRPEELAGPGALGILGMRERALAWGGRLEILPNEGGGTLLTVTIPREWDGNPT